MTVYAETVTQPLHVVPLAIRTYRATCNEIRDGAIVTTWTHILTISGTGPADYRTTLNGQPCTVARALTVTEWALATGSWVKLSEVAA